MVKKKAIPIHANKVHYVFGIVIVFLALLYTIQNVSSLEIWTHLKTGEWILRHHSVPHKDIFSYTFYGKEWIDFEWLFQAIVYSTYHYFQFKGLVFLKAVIIILVLFVLYKNGTLFDRGAHWLTFLALVLILNTIKPRIVMRPQIFLLLFLSIYIYVLNLYYFGNKNYLYLLPFFQAFWVNIHGSFILGMVLPGLYFLITVAQSLWANRNNIGAVFKSQRLRAPFISICLVIIASFISPYGYQIYVIPLRTAFAQEAQGFIGEWSPIPLKSLLLFPLDTVFWFKIFFLLVLSSFLFRKGGFKEIEHVALFALFSYMAFTHHRFAGAFGVAMGHVFISNMSNIIGNKLSEKDSISTWKWVSIILVVSLSFFVWGYQKEYREFGLHVRRGYYPEGVVKFIKEKGIKGNIFNSFDYGGFLIWHLYPQLKVFIDGRVPTVYSEDFFWLHRQGLENGKVWEKLVHEYDIDVVLIDDKRENGYRLFVKQLDDDPSWSIVAFDEVSILYLRDKPRFKETISKYKYKYFRPGDISLGYAAYQKNKDFLKNLIQELRQVEEEGLKNFYIYHSLGMANLLSDEPAQLENASSYFTRALSIKPDCDFGHFNLGLTLMRLENYEQAMKEFEKTATINPDYPHVYYYLGICAYEKGDFDRAVELLEKHKQIFGDKTGKGTYEYLGLAYLKTFQLQKAVSCFLRESYLSEAAFQIYENLGLAYFGLGDYRNASTYFQQALNLKPNDIRVLYNIGICYESLQEAEKASSVFKKLTNLPAQTEEERALIERARGKLEK